MIRATFLTAVTLVLASAINGRPLPRPNAPGMLASPRSVSQAAIITPAADLRLGLVGTDSSHVTAFAAAFNDSSSPQHVAGARIVAAYRGGSPDLPSSRDRIDNFTTQLHDKYGVRWQITPVALMEMMGSKNKKKAARVAAEMQRQVKFDIKKLKAAFDGI